jgi:hypothetical protein
MARINTDGGDESIKPSVPNRAQLIKKQKQGSAPKIDGQNLRAVMTVLGIQQEYGHGYHYD